MVEQVLALFDRAEIVTRARMVVARDRLELAAALVDAGELERGRAAAERVLEETGDPEVRSLVVAEVDRIVQVAERNQAVARFNPALAVARSGDPSAARRLLGGIQRHTRDAGLLEAVRSLRDELKLTGSVVSPLPSEAAALKPVGHPPPIR